MGLDGALRLLDDRLAVGRAVTGSGRDARHDATAEGHQDRSGDGSYGAGRYLIDTIKGSWLGGNEDGIVLDLNFAYHPSCRYDDRWRCPLAPLGNTVTYRVEAGERM